MSAGLFFESIQQSEIEVCGIKAKSPGFYRDLSLTMAIFAADRRAVSDLMPSRRLTPISPLPGIALVAVNCFEYRDSSVGPYNEVGISAAIDLDRRWLPGLLSVTRSMLKDSYDGYVMQLPVSTEIAVQAGIDIFNYPKFLADISFDDDGARQHCQVHDPQSHALIYSLSVDKPKTRTPSQRGPRREDLQTITFSSYPLKDGELHCARFVLNPLEIGQTFLGGDVSLRLGDHPHARMLADLKLGRLLQLVYMPRCEGILYQPLPIHGETGR